MLSGSLICDGCGQTSDQEHIARRLKRLENMTRYRPIHVQALFLAATSPTFDAEYLYSAEDELRGEGLKLLGALGIESSGRTVEAVLTDFQRRGFLLVHILECPGPQADPQALGGLLDRGFAATATRIRRSLKPKKLLLISESLDAFAERLTSALSGVEVVQPEHGRSFRLDELSTGALASALSPTAAASL